MLGEEPCAQNRSQPLNRGQQLVAEVFDPLASACYNAEVAPKFKQITSEANCTRQVVEKAIEGANSFLHNRLVSDELRGNGSYVEKDGISDNTTNTKEGFDSAARLLCDRALVGVKQKYDQHLQHILQDIDITEEHIIEGDNRTEPVAQSLQQGSSIEKTSTSKKAWTWVTIGLISGGSIVVVGVVIGTAALACRVYNKFYDNKSKKRRKDPSFREPLLRV